MDQYNKDLLAIREHPNQESLMADTALYNRLIDYNKRDMLPSAEIKAILERTPLPENSRSKVVSDSLRKESEKPIVETKPEPVKRSALEAFAQAVAPRTFDRYEKGVEGTGGRLAAAVLDGTTLIPRVINTAGHLPIDVWNTAQDKNYTGGGLSDIGDITGKSFNTPTLPGFVENIPYVGKPVASVAHAVNPIAQAIGEFGTSVARGPLIPGGPVSTGGKTALGWIGKPLATEAIPSALKTALGFIENLGTGAALGTSESVARGEGFDPWAAGFGGLLGGGLPLVGKGVVAGGRYLSDKKTGNILLDAQHDKINSALADLNLTQAELARKTLELDANPGNTKIKDQVTKLTNQVKTAKNYYDKVVKQSPSGQSSDIKMPREYWEKHPAELAQMYKSGLDIKASGRGYTGEKPTSLMDALEIYSPKRNPIIPMGEAENAVDNLAQARQLSSQVRSDLQSKAAAGKLGALFQLTDLLNGESYFPEKFINPISRNLPDASYTVQPIIRGATTLKDYFSQDSTKIQ